MSPALRLALARTLAWALLVAAWLGLGQAGHQHLRLWAGGLLPLALWLAATAALQASLRGRRLGMGAVRAALLLATAATGLAAARLQHPATPGWATAPALLAAALGTAVLVVAASLTVQTLRRTAHTRPPPPLLPACAGATLGWAATTVGSTQLPIAIALLAAAAATLAALLPRQAAPVAGCPGGLFDCALPWPPAAAWRQAADWPLLSARLAMLPMMASLPAMADWCSSGGWLTPELSVLSHLAAMLLPALALRPWLAQTSLRARRRAVLALLLGSGLALLAWPGLNGLMAAAGLQAGAWSLAWAGPLLAAAGPEQGAGRPPQHAAALPTQPVCARRGARLGWWAAAATAPAGALVATGLLIDHLGPQGLGAVQLLLVGVALGGAVGAMAGGGLPQAPHPAGVAPAGRRRWFV